jgi:hypothetical protein
LVDPDGDCIEGFVAAFGPRVFRRPITAAEHERMVATYWAQDANSADARLENLLLYLLQSPHFVYRPEVFGDGDDPEATHRLSDHELASRLSYLLWGSMPDEALLAAAAAGQLDEVGVVEHAERLLDHPRGRAGLRRFYEEWLEIGDRPGIGFSERFLDGLPTDGLRDDIMAEPVRLAEWMTLQGNGSLADLWTSRFAFVDTPGLASIYGVRPGGDQPVELPKGREGLLTRAALLVASSEETPPIVRGAFISKHLLCNQIALPDATDFPTDQFEPPPFDPDKTNRERWEEKTAAPACAACHQYINPYGFAAEGFDSIGRTRTHEEIIDPQGEVANLLPVDTRTSAVIDGEIVEVADLVELQAALVDSDAAARCFVEQWFRYGFGREPELEDLDTLDALAVDALDATLRDLLLEMIRSPQFRYVRVEP